MNRKARSRSCSDLTQMMSNRKTKGRKSPISLTRSEDEQHEDNMDGFLTDRPSLSAQIQPTPSPNLMPPMQLPVSIVQLRSIEEVDEPCSPGQYKPAKKTRPQIRPTSSCRHLGVRPMSLDMDISTQSNFTARFQQYEAEEKRLFRENPLASTQVIPMKSSNLMSVEDMASFEDVDTDDENDMQL